MTFKKGVSGNPLGRPKGRKSNRTLILEALRENSFLTGIKGEIDSLINLIVKADSITSQQAELELVKRLRALR